MTFIKIVQFEVWEEQEFVEREVFPRATPWRLPDVEELRSGRVEESKYVTTSLINLSIRAPAVNQVLNPPSNQALAASEAKSSQARCREGVNSATAAVLHAVSSRRVWRRNGCVVMIKIISFHTVWRCLQTAARDIKRPLWSRAKGSLRPEADYGQRAASMAAFFVKAAIARRLRSDAGKHQMARLTSTTALAHRLRSRGLKFVPVGE